MLKLGFAEVEKGNCKTGQRVMDLSVNGEILVKDLDVFQEVGCYGALIIEKGVVLTGESEFILELAPADSTYDLPMISLLIASQPVATPNPSSAPSEAPSTSPTAPDGTCYRFNYDCYCGGHADYDAQSTLKSALKRPYQPQDPPSAHSAMLTTNRDTTIPQCRPVEIETCYVVDDALSMNLVNTTTHEALGKLNYGVSTPPSDAIKKVGDSTFKMDKIAQGEPRKLRGFARIASFPFVRKGDN